MLDGADCKTAVLRTERKRDQHNNWTKRLKQNRCAERNKKTVLWKRRFTAQTSTHLRNANLAKKQNQKQKKHSFCTWHHVLSPCLSLNSYFWISDRQTSRTGFSYRLVLGHPTVISLDPHRYCWQQLKVEPSSLNIHEAITLTQSCAYSLYKTGQNSCQMKCTTEEKNGCEMKRWTEKDSTVSCPFPVASKRNNPSRLCCPMFSFNRVFKWICAVLSETNEIYIWDAVV